MNDENRNPQYPPQGQPYPPYQQPQYQPPQPQKQGGVKMGVIIGIIIGAIVLISIIAVLLVQNKHIEDKKMVKEIQSNTLMDYSTYSSTETQRKLVVDGIEISLPQHMLNINNSSYISLEDFSKVFNFEYKMDAHNKKTTVKTPKRTAEFMQNVQNVTVTDGGSSWQVDMGAGNTVYMFNNETTYVPVRGIREVFAFKSVDWNESTKSIEIVTDGTLTVNAGK